MSKNISIAFFWIGKNTDIPSCLVQSIKISMNDNVYIVQLTDRETPEVVGVDDVKRFDLSNEIMLARLEAYSKYDPQAEITFFCDADSLFIKEIELPSNHKNIFLVRRKDDFKIYPNYPEFYPEFINKNASDVMPYLFGMIVTRFNQKKFFENLYNICLKLPKRFHRWYGDQYSLKHFIDQGFNDYEILNNEIYLKVLKERLTLNYLQNAYKNNLNFITFKGPKSKVFLKDALDLLKFFNENKIK